MANLRTTDESVRSSIDGTEQVRLATAGANWKAALSAVFLALGPTVGPIIGTTPITGGSSGAVLYNTAGGTFGGNANFTTDGSAHVYINPNGTTTGGTLLEARGVNGNIVNLLASEFSNDNSCGSISFQKSRGSVGAQGLVSAGDNLGALNWQASDGSNWQIAAQILVQAQGTPSVANSVPSVFFLRTVDQTTKALQSRITIDSVGNIVINPDGLINSTLTQYTKQFYYPSIVALDVNSGVGLNFSPTDGSGTHWASYFIASYNQLQFHGPVSGYLIFGNDSGGGGLNQWMIVDPVGNFFLTGTTLSPGTVNAGLFNQATVSAEPTGAPALYYGANHSAPQVVDYTRNVLYQYANGSWKDVAQYRSGCGVIGPGYSSVVGNGSTDDSGAIATVMASNTEVDVLPATYKFSVSKNFSGKRFKFHAGAQFSIAAGVVVDFSNCVVEAPANAQIFTLAGTNGVSGLSFARPEWFGAARDGSTDDSGAFNNALYAISHANSAVGGGRSTLQFSAGTYALGAQVALTPQANSTFALLGAGIVGSNSYCPATKFLSKSTSSGTCLLLFANTTIDAVISDLYLQNQTAGSGAGTGFYIGYSSTGELQGQGTGAIKIENVYSSGFSVNFSQQNARCILWSRCFSWPGDNSGTNTTAGVGWQLIVAGTAPFCGDTDFDHCQFVADNSTGGHCVNLDDGGIASAQIAGVRFNKCDFYAGTGNNSSTICARLNSTGSGAKVMDIWFTGGCQFENQTSGGTGIAINIFANTGGTVGDIHIDHGYFSGFGWTTGVSGSTGNNASGVNNIWVTNNFFVNCTAAAVNFTGSGTGGAGLTKGFNVLGNIHNVGVNITSSWVFSTLYGDVNCSHNTVTLVGTPTVTNGVQFISSGDRAAVLGNISHATNSVVTGSWTNIIQGGSTTTNQ